MKLLFENWRKFLKEANNFTVLCENHKQGLITEEQLYNKWEQMVIFEASQVLNEGLLDILRGGYEKGKELFTKAVEKVASFFKKLVFQALKMMLTANVQLDKIAGVLKSIMQKVAKFCSAHKTLCKIITTILVMLAVTAVMAGLAGEVEAAISTGGYTGEETTLNDTGLDAIKGFLSVAQDEFPSEIGGSRESRMFAQAVEWLEHAQGMDELVDLKNSSEEGADIIRWAYESINEMIDSGEMGRSDLRELAEIGERISVESGRFTRTILGAPDEFYEGPVQLVSQPR